MTRFSQVLRSHQVRIGALSSLFLASFLLTSLPASGSLGASEGSVGRAIIERASYPALWDGTVLGGAGVQRLIADAEAAQFVIVVESHNDHATPLITLDLFRQLSEREGFRFLAIEQDPLGMEAASSPSVRGSRSAITAHACRYPYSFTFATDEELALLEQVGRMSSAGSPIWGIDQLFGASAALEELAHTAQDGPAKMLAQSLLAQATEWERWREPATAHYLSSQATELTSRFAELKELMQPAPGTRTAELLELLQVSARIYSYYTRAREPDDVGAPLGLLNNWAREEWMKHRFMQNYRAAQDAGDDHPRVLVKAGYWHSVRGLGPGNVFTLGTFLHEFAIANGAKALTVQILPIREWWPSHEQVEPAYRALLAPDALTRATLVDLRPVRQHLHMGRSFGLTGEDLVQFRSLVFGVDYAFFVPSRAGSDALAKCRAAASEVTADRKQRNRGR